MDKMTNEEFSMMYELVDIDSVEDVGYENVIDISVSGNKTFLLSNGIISHNSAVGGIVEPLGRKEAAYYALKGKPLNAYSASQQKFMANKELTELFNIIKNGDYEYIVTATDQDLDGIHIRGLIMGFIHKYLPEYKDNLCILNTPVIIVKKNKKPIRWYYNLRDEIELKPGETSHYIKGLGSLKSTELEYIVNTDGLDKMIKVLDFDGSEKVIEDWLGDDSKPRKDYIVNNEFNIAKL